MVSGDRCEYEHLDYCLANAEHSDYHCQYAIPPKEGEICDKCGATDEDMEEWEVSGS